MIQRIQSVYLLVVSILMVICICNPVGSIIANTNEISEFGNLFITLPDGTKDYAPWALFVILLVVAVLAFDTIYGATQVMHLEHTVQAAAAEQTGMRLNAKAPKAATLNVAPATLR